MHARPSMHSCARAHMHTCARVTRVLPSFHPSIHLPIYPSIHPRSIPDPSTRKHARPSIHPPIHQPTHAHMHAHTTHPSIYSPIHHPSRSQKPESGFKSDFSRAQVTDFSSGDREARTPKTSTLENSASKLFLNFRKEICKTVRAPNRQSALFYSISQSRPCFSHALHWAPA